MSGIKVELDVDDQEFRQAMRLFVERGQKLRPAMKSIGEAMLRSTEERFRSERDPQGKAWAPLSPAYAKRKQGTKILTESSALRSIVFKASEKGVTWGTNRIYGAIHQLGGTIKQQARTQVLAFGHGRFQSRKESSKKTHQVDGKRRKKTETSIRFANIGARTIKMPARPYLGVNRKDRETIREILADHLTDE